MKAKVQRLGFSVVLATLLVAAVLVFLPAMGQTSEAVLAAAPAEINAAAQGAWVTATVPVSIAVAETDEAVVTGTADAGLVEFRLYNADKACQSDIILSGGSYDGRECREDPSQRYVYAGVNVTGTASLNVGIRVLNSTQPVSRTWTWQSVVISGTDRSVEPVVVVSGTMLVEFVPRPGIAELSLNGPVTATAGQPFTYAANITATVELSPSLSLRYWRMDDLTVQIACSALFGHAYKDDSPHALNMCLYKPPDTNQAVVTDTVTMVITDTQPGTVKAHATLILYEAVPMVWIDVGPVTTTIVAPPPVTYWTFLPIVAKGYRSQYVGPLEMNITDGILTIVPESGTTLWIGTSYEWWLTGHFTRTFEVLEGNIGAFPPDRCDWQEWFCDGIMTDTVRLTPRVPGEIPVFITTCDSTGQNCGGTQEFMLNVKPAWEVKNVGWNWNEGTLTLTQQYTQLLPAYGDAHYEAWWWGDLSLLWPTANINYVNPYTRTIWSPLPQGPVQSVWKKGYDSSSLTFGIVGYGSVGRLTKVLGSYWPGWCPPDCLASLAATPTTQVEKALMAAKWTKWIQPSVPLPAAK